MILDVIFFEQKVFSGSQDICQTFTSFISMLSLNLFLIDMNSSAVEKSIWLVKYNSNTKTFLVSHMGDKLLDKHANMTTIIEYTRLTTPIW